MSAPAEGDLAPDFTLPDQDGEPVRLSDFRGKTVILYFYPRDDTPGCTKQACELRDRHAEVERADAVVLGVSPDSAKSHTKFRAKYDLPFTLLSDPDHAVAEAYGVWKPKKLYGIVRLGIERSTFVIGPDGVIVRALRRVRAAGHAERVLATLED